MPEVGIARHFKHHQKGAGGTRFEQVQMRARLILTAAFSAIVSGCLHEPHSPAIRASALPQGCGIGSAGFDDAGPNIRLVFSVTHDPTGVFLGTAVLVRAPKEWLARKWERLPASPRRGPFGTGGGATAGPLWIGYQADINTVWLDTLKVPMREQNILLVAVGADSVAHIAKASYVEPKFDIPGRACAAYDRSDMQKVDEQIWALLRSSKDVRDFMKGP